MGLTPDSRRNRYAMQFSQAQIRETLGMSVETLRHWKRVLPPFAERKKYTLGDLLAAGILHRLTEQCGVRAGCLSTISKSVVEICNANAWAALNDKTLVIDVQNGTCSLVRDVGSFLLRTRSSFVRFVG